MGTGSRQRLAAALTLITAVSAACGGADDAGDAVVRRDSAGIEIVESMGAAWGDSSHWAVDFEPILDLAEAGEGESYEFFGATDATRLSDGSIAVSEQGGTQVRVFSPAGELVRVLGREGDGPGEFRRPDQVMALPGDSIWVYDFWQSRITVFAPDGRVARVVTMANQIRSRPLLPLASGGYVGLTSDYTGFGDEFGLHRMPNPVLRMDTAGVPRDTLAVLPGYESVTFRLGDAWAVWGKAGHMAVRGDSLFLGAADSLEYEVRDSDGRLTRIARVPGYDLTLTEAEIRAEDRAFIPDPAAATQVVREIMDQQAEHTHRPAYSALLLDRSGHVWLEAYRGRHEQDEPRDWFVFDPTGRWLGTVTLPPRFQAFRIWEDRILGSRPDQLDVEHIQLLRLRR